MQTHAPGEASGLFCHVLAELERTFPLFPGPPVR